MPLFETLHLYARAFTPGDFDAIKAIATAPDAVIAGDTMISRATFDRWIANVPPEPYDVGDCAYAVIAKPLHTLIGWCGLVASSAADAESELVYGFTLEAWGQGHVTHLARLFVDVGFEEHDVDTIIARVDPANEAAVDIVTVLRMTYERDAPQPNGDVQHVYIAHNARKLAEALGDLRDSTSRRLFDVFEQSLKQPKPTRLTHDPTSAVETTLSDLLSGQWRENGATMKRLVQAMSKPDYLDALTDEAYLAYLPDFLLITNAIPTMLLQPDAVPTRLLRILPHLSAEQLDALIVYFEHQAQYASFSGWLDRIPLFRNAQQQVRAHRAARSG